jgi:glycosyltransferase involved in cell wall biosynthesis
MTSHYFADNVKLLHVVPAIEDEASGVTYGVTRLCDSIVQQGIELELHCLAASDNGARTYIRRHQPGFLGLRPLGWSSELFKNLEKASSPDCIIHNHSLWMMPNVYPAWVASKKGCKLVTSPHGTLSYQALARSRWRKKLFWPIQRGTLTNAACVHVTSEDEFHAVRALGLRAPVAVIPYGIDIPDQPEKDRSMTHRRLLFLSRIHPIKGLELLLRVWRRLEVAFSDWELVIVGQGEPDYLRSLQQLSHSLGLRRASFPGPSYGFEKSRVYWQSDLFVLPTQTENFGFVVAEALAHGVPAVVSHGAPWQGLETYQCGWWIRLSEASLYETLHGAMSMEAQDLKRMGERGREWMRRDFSWEEVGRRMALTYAWILGLQPRPGWVSVD